VTQLRCPYQFQWSGNSAVQCIWIQTVFVQWSYAFESFSLPLREFPQPEQMSAQMIFLFLTQQLFQTMYSFLHHFSRYDCFHQNLLLVTNRFLFLRQSFWLKAKQKYVRYCFWLILL